jgi:hypothetical protein
MTNDDESSIPASPNRNPRPTTSPNHRQTKAPTSLAYSSHAAPYATYLPPNADYTNTAGEPTPLELASQHTGSTGGSPATDKASAAKAGQLAREKLAGIGHYSMRLLRPATREVTAELGGSQQIPSDAGTSDDLLWEGTTWDALPFPFMWLTPV